MEKSKCIKPCSCRLYKAKSALQKMEIQPQSSQERVMPELWQVGEREIWK